MDSITHIILGGAIGQCLGKSRVGRAAFWLGAWAATVPDLDVFRYTGHPVDDHLTHRTFMHALILMPLLAFFALHPFLLIKKVRAHWRWMWLVAFVAILSHPFLDACTSYGTMMFWPFDDTRIAWDTVSVVDPIFTAFVLLGVLAAAWKKRSRFALIGILAGIAYLGLGFWQHHRAWVAQRDLATARGDAIEKARVMPTLGNLIVWRSVYLSEGKIHADAIRIALFGPAQILQGKSIAQARPNDLDPQTPPPSRRDIAGFFRFADGFVARTDDGTRDGTGDGFVFADERYSIGTADFEPVWGVRVSVSGTSWEILTPRHVLPQARALWREIRGSDQGFEPLDAVTKH